MAMTTATGIAVLVRQNKAESQLQASPVVGDSTATDRMTHLDGKIGRLEQRIGRLAATSVGRNLSELPPTALPVRTRRQIEPEEERQFLNGILANEQRDHDWAPRFEADLASSLRQKFPNDSITHLSCKTSICRIDVAHSKGDSRDTFHKGFGYLLPQATHARVNIRKGEGEQWITEIHVIRPGQNPPEMSDG
jgi:hypothetical protein